MSTMYYNGVELPALPHWDGMPPDYQFIFLSGGYYYLAGTNSAPFCVLVNGADRVALRADVIFTAFEAKAGAEEWGKLAYTVAPFATLTDEGYVFAEAITFIWTQRDIPSATEGEIYLKGTEPTEPAPETDPLIMYRRGWMDGFLSGLNARGLLHRRKVEEPQPVTAYLYGTPSPTVVTYNGVELPELPEWDKTKYPCVYITKNSSGVIRILCSYIPLEYGTYSSSGTDYTKIYLNIPKGEISTTWNFDLAENAWGEGYERNWDRTGNDLNYKLTFASVIWCNTDIPNIDNNTTYLAASEPVRTNSGNVALADGDGFVLYNGAVLPKLPEWDKTAYPYAVIISHNSTNYYFFTCTDPMYIVKESSGTYLEAENSQNLTYNANFWLYKDGAWDSRGGYNLRLGVIDASGNPFYTPIWSNTDIPNIDNNTTYLAASDPIPLASSEPVAYRYNGVELPELPEWDMEAYPYAIIAQNSDGDIYFECATKLMQYGTFTSGGVSYTNPHYLILAGEIASREYRFLSNNSWGEPKTAVWDRTDKTTNLRSRTEKVIWCNTDIPNIDNNTVYLAASAPVPVYE